MNDSPIGIFDSGVGGLTVMKEIAHLLPSESIIYYGDTARMPYGGKSRETILRYSFENTLFLLEKKVKLIVVACNTAAAYSLDKLQAFFSTPVMSVIEPGIEKVLQTTTRGKIGVIGTQGTIRSGIYQNAFKKALPQGNIIAQACPLLASLVEERLTGHPATRLLLQDYLEPLKRAQIDTLLLACTHYPLLKNAIALEMGPEVTIIDSALACAKKVGETLALQNLTTGQSQGFYEYFVSDDPQKFQQIGEEFLGFTLAQVQPTIIQPDQYFVNPVGRGEPKSIASLS